MGQHDAAYMTPTVDFMLPSDLEASAPPEELGKRRDQVRLMVGTRSTGRIVDDVFALLSRYVKTGDVLVINTSKTVPAAIACRTNAGLDIVIHLSSPTQDGKWVVEVRSPAGFGTLPGPDLEPQTIELPGHAHIDLLNHVAGSSRLWLADVEIDGDLLAYLERHGSPVRYGYAAGPWPLNSYQTVYGRQPGSAEMPSAGRPFTSELLTALTASGVAVMPIVLHSGVASLEAGERPGSERCIVPSNTAAVVNAIKKNGGRVIAVGTTSTRALETAATPDGKVAPFEGYTDLIIGSDGPLRVVDGLVTGWHEPRATHLDLVEAVAGADLAGRMYEHALAEGYRWHEFGDSCLILP